VHRYSDIEIFGYSLKGARSAALPLDRARHLGGGAVISRNTQSASASAAQVTSNLQELHATVAEVGTASGDIRGKIGSLGESVQALRTGTFLRDVLAA
jgi:hypothetical protein